MVARSPVADGASASGTHPPPRVASGTSDSSEGDINLSPRRRAWERDHVRGITRALLDRDAAAFLHQSLSTPCFDALVEAEGIWLTDADGRRFMDFHGNNVHQVGYRHPRVIDAVKRQLDTLPFSPRRFTNATAVELAERLGALAPDPLGKVLFAPGGTLAIGMALKLARVATGRHKTISMWDAFHGASLDAISIGGEAVFRRDIGPLMPGTEHVPPCDPHACRFRCGGACDASCADYVDYVLGKEQDVAAVVVETVRCTDVQVPPEAYYRRLRAACDRHGALLVLDEVPIGLGRTGTMFAFEHYGIVPDMVVLGKGLGGAVFPMAALIARRGNVVHMCSVAGFVAGGSTAGYVVSKGAVRSLTQVMARDLAPHGVRVNAVAPGIMASEMATAQLNRPGGADWFLNRVPMKRIGETREIVDPVIFLASDMASFVTGAILPVDGGFLAA